MKRSAVKRILKENSGSFGGYSDALVNASRAGLRRRVLQNLPEALKEREAFDAIQKEDVAKLLRYKYKARDLQQLTQEVSGRVRKMLLESGIDAPTQESIQTISDAILRKETEGLPLQAIYDLIKSNSNAPSSRAFDIPPQVSETTETPPDEGNGDGEDGLDGASPDEDALRELLPAQLRTETRQKNVDEIKRTLPVLDDAEAKQLETLERAQNGEPEPQKYHYPPQEPESEPAKDWRSQVADVIDEVDKNPPDVSNLLPPNLKPEAVSSPKKKKKKSKKTEPMASIPEETSYDVSSEEPSKPELQALLPAYLHQEDATPHALPTDTEIVKPEAVETLEPPPPLMSLDEPPIPAHIETLLPEKLKDEAHADARAQEESFQTPPPRRRMHIEETTEDAEAETPDFSAFQTPYPAPETPAPEEIEEVKSLLPETLKKEAEPADPETVRKAERKSAKKDKEKAVKVKKIKDLQSVIEKLETNKDGLVLAPKTKDERITEILSQYKKTHNTKKNPSKSVLLDFFASLHPNE